MQQVVDRLAQAVSEGRADCDHDLVGPAAGLGVAGVDEQRRPVGCRRGEGARVEDVRQRLQQLPPVAVERPARAGAGVEVGIADRRAHLAVGLDDGRRLQIVPRDALPLHREDGLGDVGEAIVRERAGNVRAGDSLHEHPVSRGDVGGAIAIGEIGAVVADRRRLDLGVGDGWKVERLEHGLHGASRRSRTRSTVSSSAGSIPPSTCQSRWIVSHSSRSSAS